MHSFLTRAPTQPRPPSRPVPAPVRHHAGRLATDPAGQYGRGGARDAPAAGSRAATDRLELEADRVADRLARPWSSAMQLGCACGGGCPRCAPSGASPGTLSPTTNREPVPPTLAGQGVVQKSLAPGYTERRQSRAGQGSPRLECYPDLNHARSRLRGWAALRARWRRSATVWSQR